MDQNRVDEIVAQWGESFRELATNPRIEFDGDEIHVRLWKPITVNGIETGRLRVIEPSFAELEKIDGVKGDMTRAKRVISAICLLTDREAGNIGLRDITLISSVAGAFGVAAPETGGML